MSIATVLCLLNALVLSALVPLACVHVYNSCRNVTTIEWIYRKHTADGHRTFPYDLGVLGNLRQLFGTSVVMWLLPIPATVRERLHLLNGLQWPLPEDSDVYWHSLTKISLMRWKKAIRTVRRRVRVGRVYDSIVVALLGTQSIRDYKQPKQHPDIKQHGLERQFSEEAIKLIG